MKFTHTVVAIGICCTMLYIGTQARTYADAKQLAQQQVEDQLISDIIDIQDRADEFEIQINVEEYSLMDLDSNRLKQIQIINDGIMRNHNLQIYFACRQYELYNDRTPIDTDDISNRMDRVVEANAICRRAKVKL